MDGSAALHPVQNPVNTGFLLFRYLGNDDFRPVMLTVESASQTDGKKGRHLVIDFRVRGFGHPGQIGKGTLW